MLKSLFKKLARINKSIYLLQFLILMIIKNKENVKSILQ